MEKYFVVIISIVDGYTPLHWHYIYFGVSPRLSRSSPRSIEHPPNTIWMWKYMSLYAIITITRHCQSGASPILTPRWPTIGENTILHQKAAAYITQTMAKKNNFVYWFIIKWPFNDYIELLLVRLQQRANRQTIFNVSIYEVRLLFLFDKLEVGTLGECFEKCMREQWKRLK